MHFEFQMKLDALIDIPLMQLRHYAFYWKAIAIHVDLVSWYLLAVDL